MIKTSRPFRERFLEGYDRNELRQEVQKVKPKFSLRQKYATWALGASLALGGMGIPLKFGRGLDHQPQPPQPKPAAASETVPTPPLTPTAINNDLSTAQKIANQVTGGVSTALNDVARTVKEAPAAVAAAPAAVAKVATNAAESVKEHFFKTQVPFGQLIYSEAKKNNLDPELVAAVVRQESKFHPTARSHAGAVGLMQLVPRTGRWLGARNLNDPTQNVMAGAKYLRYLTDRFNGNTEKAVAAYNAGEGNVRRFGGVPPFRETRNYVQRVKGFQSEISDRIAGYDIPQDATAR